MKICEKYKNKTPDGRLGKAQTEEIERKGRRKASIDSQ